MTDRAVLAIDQGTSGTKALMLGEDGTVLDTATHPLDQYVPGPGMVEQAPEELWNSVCAAVAALTSRRQERVDGIALSTQRESVLAWDAETGCAVSPLISWQDRRTADRCAESLADHADDITAVTGLPVDPMFSATKAQWLLEDDERMREDATAGRIRFGTVDGWLIKRMTGADRCEIGNAARTQLLDIRTGQWSQYLLDVFGVPAASLPAVVPSTGEFGWVSDVPGVPDGTPLVAVAGDSHAALYAQCAGRQGVVKATYGSGSSLMTLESGDAAPASGLARTIAWQQEGAAPALAVEANIAAAGTAVRWVRDLLGLDEDGVRALVEHWPNGDVPVLVPAFNGLGAPYWDRRAKAALIDFHQATGPAELVRAAVESIAFQVNDALELIAETVGGITELCADGGASTNDRLMQFQADISGTEVLRSARATNSALGAAYLAGIRLGMWREDQLSELAGEPDRFRPMRGDSWRTARREKWRDALDRARG